MQHHVLDLPTVLARRQEYLWTQWLQLIGSNDIIVGYGCLLTRGRTLVAEGCLHFGKNVLEVLAN
jgi:hypothetical protein